MKKTKKWKKLRELSHVKKNEKLKISVKFSKKKKMETNWTGLKTKIDNYSYYWLKLQIILIIFISYSSFFNKKKQMIQNLAKIYLILVCKYG
jgi:hypothetical protein